jgi:hypothetical protein
LIIAMDCRKFHRNLEDYLQGGLDFSGRFGMERHAQQCISCGEDLANAQRLSQMTSGLERVKAPLNFEASLLQEIGKRKSHGRFSYLYRTWIYGFDSLSWRKLALAGCGCAALGLGIAYWPRHSPGVLPNSLPAPSYVAAEQTKEVSYESEKPVAAVHEPATPEARPVMHSSKARSEIRPLQPEQEERFTEPEIADTDYMEYVMEGPDNRPVTVRLPKKIRMQYGHASEEYFIRNVSH